MEAKYCIQCGEKLTHIVPKNDSLVRGVCLRCDTTHYDNPKIIVSSIVECNERVLLCKRAIKPRMGYWTLPGGYMENNETLEEAAIRETEEETGVVVNKVELYSIFNCPSISQVYMVFRGKTTDDFTCKTVESDDVKYFSKKDLPWEKLSYSVMYYALDWYFDDLKQNNFLIRIKDVQKKYI